MSTHNIVSRSNKKNQNSSDGKSTLSGAIIEVKKNVDTTPKTDNFYIGSSGPG